MYALKVSLSLIVLILFAIISLSVLREANQLSEEMGKETEFAVTLQVYL